MDRCYEPGKREKRHGLHGVSRWRILMIDEWLGHALVSFGDLEATERPSIPQLSLNLWKQQKPGLWV